MLSLRSLCLLKVSSLKLSYKEDEVPYTLVTELKQMLLFNGNFFGQEEYFYFGLAIKEHVLTIQYQGDGTWAFGICHMWDRCTDRTCDGNKHCGKRPERLQFVLKEKQTCDSQAVFKIVRGLSRFRLIGGRIYRGKREVSTVLTVEHANVPGQPDSGHLVLTTSAVRESGDEISCKLWVNSTSGSSPVFRCSATVRISPELLQTGEPDLLQTGEIPLHLTECQVAAKEAFPETVHKCELLDENLADGEEDVDDEEWFDGEEETDDEAMTDGEEETDDEAMTDGEEETDDEAMTDGEEDTGDEAMNDGEEEADDQ
eukprot:GFUD01042598.1.p1 GENE.GFUD01042598.1~~GFUD01042598.1.p1  ORF type:complete len:314 (+),score=83.41 GFUD01042598.1:352-1293(+)